MIAVVQRVNSCTIRIENHDNITIDKGLLVLLGIESNDTDKDIKYCAKKIINLRIFNDNQGKMNLSVKDINAEVMVVSQFTLCGDTQKGNRPSYISAMSANMARELYNQFLDHISEIYDHVKSGIFQADMNILLENAGPVTLTIRSND